MNQTTEEKKDVTKIIKDVLAQEIGVETEDIQDTDSFADDLHMTATNLTDFIETLGSHEIDTTKIDLSEITTVEELTEVLSDQEPIT